MKADEPNKGNPFVLPLCANRWLRLDQSTFRADKPASREAAAKDIDIPFSILAMNIYYVFHAGGLQEYQMFVRFTVGPREESNAVDEILADHNKRTGFLSCCFTRKHDESSRFWTIADGVVESQVSEQWLFARQHEWPTVLHLGGFV